MAKSCNHQATRRYIFRQQTPEEAAAARKRKAEFAPKAPVGGASPGRLASKRAKVSPPPDGPLPRGPSAERAVADAGLAQALHDLQKQNQVGLRTSTCLEAAMFASKIYVQGVCFVFGT